MLGTYIYDSKIEIILEIVQADFEIIIFIQLNKYKDDKYLSDVGLREI